MSVNPENKLTMSSGWKSFDELKSKYSPAEIKFEKGRRSVGLWLGPLLFILLLLMPTPLGMTFKAKQILAVAAWTMTWWICEPVPIPASGILPFILIPAMGIAPVSTVFSVLGHENNWLMIGAYIFMGALVEHGFTKRMALWLLSRKVAARSPFALMATFTFAVAILSAFLSNIACTMLFLVIGAGICEALNVSEDHPFSKSLKFSAAYASQAGGMITPIGAPNTNFLAIGLIASLAHYQIRFADWMAFGIPLGVIMLVIILIYFRGIFKMDINDLERARVYSEEQLKAMGKLSIGERNGLIALIIATVLWLIPSGTAMIYGNNAEVTKYFDALLNGSVVALFAAVLCFLMPIDWKERKFTLNWTNAERSVNWGAIIIVSTGFALGNVMNAKDVGLVAWSANSLAHVFTGAAPWLIVLGFTCIGILLTQFLPNVPAIAILVPVGVPTAIAVGLNPIALGLTVAVACQQSYAMPIAAPQMALVYGSGGLKITEFIKVGAILCLLSIPVTVFVYYYTAWLFPYIP
ncbi:SLC13 family permease [Desulfitobacterium sp. AusDCA]|uniref:SLC13 family permease n=1 Tax=Desulfitobacterium sp. AusDCA TaxID=3240383 RepID=UPI003DA7796D